MGQWKTDLGCKHRATGAIIILISAALLVYGLKFGLELWQNGIFFLVLVSGIVTVDFGLTKIDVKEDRKYQDFLRKSSKMSMIMFPLGLLLTFTLGTISIGLIYAKSYFMGTIFSSVTGVVGMVFLGFALFTEYDTVMKSINHVSKSENRTYKMKALIAYIVTFAGGFILWYYVKYVLFA